MSRSYLNRRTAPHITTLVLATTTGALAMNVFVPALPAMARYFETDYAIMQLAVSFYIGATAILQLFIGPASDRFGRRPVMLICLGIFNLATLAAIFAPSIGYLLLFRTLQGFAAAGMVLSRAIVRDTVGADLAASRLGYITMGMTLAPMLGPAIGGVLDEWFGWQSTFLLTLGMGCLAFLVVFADMGETNKSPSSSLGAQFAAYPELLRSRRFWGYTATAAFTSGGFFAFLGGAPYISSEVLRLSPSVYGAYFAIISLGYMTGNFLSGRLAARLGINRMMLSGNVIAGLGSLLALGLYASGFLHPIALFGPAFFTGIGNGVTLPSANAGMVSVRPHLAGSASGLGGALQIGGGGAMSIISGVLLTPESNVVPLFTIMLLTAVAAIVVNLYVIHVARQAGEL